VPPADFRQIQFQNLPPLPDVNAGFIHQYISPIDEMTIVESAPARKHYFDFGGEARLLLR